VSTTAAPSAWVRFAVAMLLIGGAANSLYGLVGLLEEEHFVPDALLFGAVTFWGGVNLVIGAIQLIIALLLWKDVPSGTSLGILIAGLNAVAQMMAIGAYPLWSTMVLAMDIAIIYALAAYGPREAV
jgi:hypothetical protein